MHFLSDNAARREPENLQRRSSPPTTVSPSPYGQDRETARAQDLLRDVFKCELQAFLVASGTAANGLALGAITPPWGAVLLP